MDLTTFLVTVFCLVDDWPASQGQRLRRRGPKPTLADSEVRVSKLRGDKRALGQIHYDTTASLSARH